jgi:zinc protease
MKKILFSIFALSLFTAVHAQKLDRSIRPKAGPAPEIKLGDAESFTLDNGLKVFVVENHKLPAVTYSIQLDVQPEPEGNKTGMNSMVGELITSGTKTRNKDKFDEEVDFISAAIGANSQSIFGRSLTKYQDRLLDLMSDALLNANFQQSDLDKLKKQALAGLEASKNEPDAMLNNVASVLNYGANHPYGEVTTEATINNITLADCNAYYKKYFRPNVAYMAIVGDINLAQAKEMANKYFGKWEKGDVVKATYPKVTAPAATEVDFVPRDGAVQSVVSITYPIDLMIGTPDVIKTVY